MGESIRLTAIRDLMTNHDYVLRWGVTGAWLTPAFVLNNPKKWGPGLRISLTTIVHGVVRGLFALHCGREITLSAEENPND